MGISFPQQNGKRMGFRSLLPFFLSLFLFFAPVVVQTVLYVTSIQSSYLIKDGVVDATNRKEDAFQNTYIKGEVEFFYNEWIVSEPKESDPSPIYLPTPGRWTNRTGVNGESLPSSGFGSYRFWITGLEAGKTIRVFPNIETPNRIYLNGTLTSQIGEPSREEQSAVIALSDQYSTSCVVPEDGIVEYVMEVGNTGGGGASHIGFIHFDGQYLFSLSSPYVASVSVGVIFAASVLLFVMLIFVPRKRLAGLLVGILLSAVFLYLFSRDSFLVGASIVFSAALFDVLGVLFFGVVIVLLLLYLAYQRNSPLVLPEVISLIGAASLMVAFYALSHGSGIEWLFLVLLASIPFYVQIRAYIAYFRNQKNDAFLVLNAMACAYGFILSMFSMNFILAPMQLHPTLFSILFALAVFTIGFSEIYRESLVKRDEALLKQRYRDIVNRSLARLSSEEETIDTLKMIGASYERSIAEGDHRLVDFTMLMRKRLMALREPVISLAKECEIESEIAELQNTVYQRQTNLVLDVEIGDLEVPPLIFEGVINELSESVNESDYVMISETKQGVRLSFPERFHISPSAKESIQERSSIAGMETRFGKGFIFLWRGKKT